MIGGGAVMTPTDRAAFLLALADRLAVAEVTTPAGDWVGVHFTRDELVLILDCLDYFGAGALVRTIFQRALRQMDAETN